MARVLLPGTLDTKGEEYAFVHDLILARGHEALVMDLGLVLFFLVYTVVVNWAVDRVVGLPASAAPIGTAATAGQGA